MPPMPPSDAPISWLQAAPCQAGPFQALAPVLFKPWRATAEVIGHFSGQVLLSVDMHPQAGNTGVDSGMLHSASQAQDGTFRIVQKEFCSYILVAHERHVEPIRKKGSLFAPAATPAELRENIQCLKFLLRKTACLYLREVEAAQADGAQIDARESAHDDRGLPGSAAKRKAPSSPPTCRKAAQQGQKDAVAAETAVGNLVATQKQTVQTEVAELRTALDGLRAELAAARAENADLRAAQARSREAALEAIVAAARQQLQGMGEQLDATVQGVGARVDKAEALADAAGDPAVSAEAHGPDGRTARD